MGHEMMIGATPEPVAINPSKTAVIVVDMQNDFGSSGGMFDRAGIDISGIQRAMGPTARVLANGRALGMKIIYLKMGYRSDLSDLGSSGARNRMVHLRFGVGEPVTSPDGSEGGVLIRDTWGTDIVTELAPQDGDIIMYKTRFSGFYGTDLDSVLKTAGITTLIVTGCTTSVCVESTIRDAFFRDYRCVLLTDCTSEPIGHGMSRSNHDASLLLIEIMFGWLSTSEQFLKSSVAISA